MSIELCARAQLIAHLPSARLLCPALHAAQSRAIVKNALMPGVVSVGAWPRSSWRSGCVPRLPSALACTGRGGRRHPALRPASSPATRGLRRPSCRPPPHGIRDRTRASGAAQPRARSGLRCHLRRATADRAPGPCRTPRDSAFVSSRAPSLWSRFRRGSGPSLPPASRQWSGLRGPTLRGSGNTEARAVPDVLAGRSRSIAPGRGSCCCSTRSGAARPMALQATHQGGERPMLSGLVSIHASATQAGRIVADSARAQAARGHHPRLHQDPVTRVLRCVRLRERAESCNVERVPCR